MSSLGLASLIDDQRFLRKINAAHSLHVSRVPFLFAFREQIVETMISFKQ